MKDLTKWVVFRKRPLSPSGEDEIISTAQTKWEAQLILEALVPYPRIRRLDYDIKRKDKE